MAELSVNQRNTTPGPIGSGTPGTGPDIPEAGEKQNERADKTGMKCHELVTTVRHQGNSGRPPVSKSVRRRETLSDVYSRDPEIPYVKFEAAVRDLVCPLMERQDRMNVTIFLKINDLASRLVDLEELHKDAGADDEQRKTSV